MKRTTFNGVLRFLKLWEKKIKKEIKDGMDSLIKPEAKVMKEMMMIDYSFKVVINFLEGVQKLRKGEKGESKAN